MFRADGEMMEETNEMVGEKIIWVFPQFSLRQPVHQVAERRRRGEKQGEAGNRLQGAINALEHHSDSEEEVDLCRFQFHCLKCRQAGRIS